MRPVKAAGEVCLPDPVVCTGSYSDTHTKIHLPIGREVQINRGKELLLLVMKRGNIAHISIIGVVFESAGDVSGDGVADLRAGSKSKSLRLVLAMKRPFEGRIQCEVQPAKLFIDDGP